jgi:tetratricopeptide (TPR) repeat protein
MLVSLIAWYALIVHARGSNAVLFWLRPEQYEMRASGTYLCPNHFAHLLAVTLCICTALVGLKSAGVPLRLLAGYGIIVCIPPLFLSASRSGWLGAACGITVTAGLLAGRRSFKRMLMCLLIVLLVLILLLVLAWFSSDMFQERLQGMDLSSPDGAVAVRLSIWKDMIPMIQDRLLWGFGGGSFRWVYPAYKTHWMQEWARYAHNEYLQALAEYGVVGLALLILCWGWAVLVFLWHFFKVERDRDAALVAGLLGALAASLVHAVFDFNFHVYANNHLLAMLGGIAAGSLISSGVIKVRPMRKVTRYVYATGGALLALLLMALSLRVLGAYSFSVRGRQKAARLQHREAVQQYEWAQRIEPDDWEAWTGLADVYRLRAFWNTDAVEKQRQAEKALSFYAEALERNPYLADTVYGQSRVYTSMGEEDRALELMRQAMALKPRYMFYRIQYGLELRRIGRYQEALEAFEAAQKVPSEVVELNIGYLKRRLKQQADNPQEKP